MVVGKDGALMHERMAAMNLEQKLDFIAAFGYGAYNLPDGRFAIADADDDENGFYLEGDNLAELVDELIENRNLDDPDYV